MHVRRELLQLLLRRTIVNKILGPGRAQRWPHFSVQLKLFPVFTGQRCRGCSAPFRKWQVKPSDRAGVLHLRPLTSTLAVCWTRCRLLLLTWWSRWITADLRAALVTSK